MMNKIGIIAPCFNEGTNILAYLKEIEDSTNEIDAFFEIIIVDDASTDNTESIISSYNSFSEKISLNILRLHSNVGHQLAIQQGLLKIAEYNCDYIIVMDSDGEDDPTIINQMFDVIEKEKKDIVHINRGKRKENFRFQLSYFFYRFLFKLITGKKMNFGNFCIFNQRTLKMINSNSFVHFPGFLLKLKIERSYICCDRKKRYSGKSKLGYEGLISHAFLSLTEFSDSLMYFMFKLLLFIAGVITLVMSYILYSKFFTHKAISGWSSLMTSSLLNAGIICWGFIVLGFLILKQQRLNITGKRLINSDFKKIF